MTFDLNWRGEEVVQLCEEKAKEIMAEFALTAEGESKRELTKGHGVKTGTLRRSIHADDADYNFGGDNVVPSGSSPERGGREIMPKKDGHRVIAALGSGLVYAMRIHQGWGKFPGYHYLTNGVEKAKGRLSAIITRHQVKE
jgi:hypothetical protein